MSLVTTKMIQISQPPALPCGSCFECICEMFTTSPTGATSSRRAGQFFLPKQFFLILAAWPGLAWPGLSIVGGFLAGRPCRFGGLGSFFLPKQFFFSFWRPGLGWRGPASQSWGGSWPAGLADFEGRAVFFSPNSFFLILAAWPGLAWAVFLLQKQFFLILATRPGLAWPGLG